MMMSIYFASEEEKDRFAKTARNDE